MKCLGQFLGQSMVLALLGPWEDDRFMLDELCDMAKMSKIWKVDGMKSMLANIAVSNQESAISRSRNY
jgi:hypothetical protein